MDYKKISQKERAALDSRIFNGRMYSRKDYAYKCRAEFYHKFNVNEWRLMVSFFGNKCCKCESEVIGGIPTKDHIIPIYFGGTNSIRNIQPLCRECNVSKRRNEFDYREEWCDRNGVSLPEKWRHPFLKINEIIEF